MNVKNLIASIGVSALLLGIGMNTHRAWNDHGIKEASLSQFVVGQGISNSTVCQCTERGGTELPDKVLQLEKYIKEIQGNGLINTALSFLSGGSLAGISSGFGLGGNIIYGYRCTCLDAPTGYTGDLGCNLSWEKICN